eukprot:14505760-Alexandrium_andersonii.AAC.1
MKSIALLPRKMLGSRHRATASRAKRAAQQRGRLLDVFVEVARNSEPSARGDLREVRGEVRNPRETTSALL